MFKKGFATYTKTGRSIQLGRACGESLARQSAKNSRNSTSNGDDTCVNISILCIVMFVVVNVIIHNITKVSIQ